MFCVDWWLECFGEDIRSIVCRRDSPNPHVVLHIILFNFVMPYVNRSCMVIHVRLCSEVFSCLVVSIKVIDVMCVAKELE